MDETHFGELVVMPPWTTYQELLQIQDPIDPKGTARISTADLLASLTQGWRQITASKPMVEVSRALKDRVVPVGVVGSGEARQPEEIPVGARGSELSSAAATARSTAAVSAACRARSSARLSDAAAGRARWGRPMPMRARPSSQGASDRTAVRRPFDISPAPGICNLEEIKTGGEISVNVQWELGGGFRQVVLRVPSEEAKVAVPGFPAKSRGRAPGPPSDSLRSTS